MKSNNGQPQQNEKRLLRTLTSRCLGWALLVCMTTSISQAEDKKEPPYPQPEFTESSTTSRPSKKSQSAPPSMDASTPAAPRPYRVDSDGVYYYKPLKDDRARKYKRLESDVRTYDPIFEDAKKTGSVAIQAGVLTQGYALTNSVNGAKFSDVYSNSSVPGVVIDYEKPIFRKLGIWSLKATGGLIVHTNGRGRFGDTTRIDYSSERPEKFTFFSFPLALSAQYKFQYADQQVLVPYAYSGLGYFGFMETRDDGGKAKFGAAPVSISGGGLQLLLDKISRDTFITLKRDYGIDHFWLIADFRAVIGINKEFDFTTQMMTAGVLVEF